MTTHHTPAPTPAVGTGADASTDRTAAADQALANRCQTSGDYLAGLITKGMLDAVSRPNKLPELMFPDSDPAVVRAVWEAALAVGYRAGKEAARPTWTPDALRHLRAELDTAGFVSMGRLAGRSASLHSPRHPADTDVPAQPGPVVRGGGHP
ncbi:hypothetical protein ABT025_18420 [Streptomyces sp. NPDC002809]|uniref:hypothetical protein n=1 Tax=Streptomyces sp. NPDC002809 TaxID=3154433 RepID=UPI00332C38FB